MASTKILILLTVFAVVGPSVLATEFIVGDDKGWALNVDYQAWAQGKEFHVGDKLVFRYQKGSHNVIKVDGAEFQQCAASAYNTDALTTGEDVITLATPGRKWYICGVAKHCASGNMKLLVTVLPQTASPAASPAPEASTSGSDVTRSSFGCMMVAFLGFLVMFNYGLIYE